MEDEVYETADEYTRVQIDAFAKFVDDNIGVDYEINESASGEPDEFYMIITDLNSEEVNMLRVYERGIVK